MLPGTTYPPFIGWTNVYFLGTIYFHATGLIIWAQFFVVLFLFFQSRCFLTLPHLPHRKSWFIDPTPRLILLQTLENFPFCSIIYCPHAVMFGLVVPWLRSVADLNPRLRLGGKCGPGLQFLLTTNQPTNQIIRTYMGVSKNSGTPKSSI